jgi:hypothetical protein
MENNITQHNTHTHTLQAQFRVQWSALLYRVISLCAPDYSIKNMQKYFKQFQSLTMIT